MKKWMTVCYCATILGVKNPTAENHLDYIEKQMLGDAMKAKITMKITTPNWKRELKVNSHIQGKDQALVFIEKPARDRGIGTLKIKNNMWNYFPRLKRTVIVSPSMLLTSWMGSDFTNDDLLNTSSLVNDYDHKKMSNTQIDGQEVIVLRNTLKKKAKAIWPLIIAYLSKETCLPYKYLYYNKENELMRVLSFKDVKEFDGHKFPSYWKMFPMNEKGKWTELIYHDIDYDVKFNEGHFSLRQLTRN